MIDIKNLRTDPKPYQESARLRGIKVDIDQLLKQDQERNELIVQIDALRSKLNVKGKPDAAELGELKKAKTELEKLEATFNKLDEQYQDLLKSVPNLLAPGTPEGGEEASREERKWGQASKPDFAIQDHATLAAEQGWVDFERGAKVAGNKFYYLKANAVKLEMALKRLGIDLLEKAGFIPMDVPHLVTSRIADGTGFLPRGEERQIYKIEGEDLNLIATAEIPLTGYHADEILDPTQLPLLYAGWSPSYRMEAGAYGKYSKGLYRVHQFNKLEMYVFCRSEDSEAWHEKLIKLEEELWQQLEIPYRVVRIAAGDLGAPAYKKYDLQYWSPVEGEYRELTSCSNVTDYQARRLNIRTKDKDGNNVFVHTLNGTAVAISRALIAIIENHQTKDGKVRIPKVLQQYYGGEYL